MITNKFQNATRAQLVEAMAASMIRHHDDGCTVTHLKLDGFSQAQIDAHVDAAREMAVAKSETQTVVRVPARKAA